MKTFISILGLIIPIISIQMQAQTIYDLQPGTKGNQITLTVSNISETISCRKFNDGNFFESITVTSSAEIVSDIFETVSVI